jgi:hypothetical protein
VSSSYLLSILVRKRTAKGGTQITNTLIKGTTRFTHAPSRTYIVVKAYGEGSDAGDKSTKKAATGLYKYALRQTFMIETGDNSDMGVRAKMPPIVLQVWTLPRTSK